MISIFSSCVTDLHLLILPDYHTLCISIRYVRQSYAASSFCHKSYPGCVVYLHTKNISSSLFAQLRQLLFLAPRLLLVVLNSSPVTKLINQRRPHIIHSRPPCPCDLKDLQVQPTNMCFMNCLNVIFSPFQHVDYTRRRCKYQGLTKRHLLVIISETTKG